MKKVTQMRTGLLLVTALLLQSPCFSQVDQLGTFMAAGKADAELLLEPYLTPAINAFGAALGAGWYNTAGTHKLGGFDITMTVNAAVVPKKYETFQIDNSKLSLLQLENPANNTSPTIVGNNEPGPRLVYNFTGYSGNAFQMPEGVNFNYIPTPMVQVGIGLIKGTEVMVRFLPKLSTRGNEIGLWGIGGKHDIKQWIPGLKHMPILQLSIMYGYTKLHTYINVKVTPDDINAGSLSGANSSTWENQQIRMVTKSQTASLLVSANLPVVCFYGGVGFISTKTTLKAEGDYPSVYLDGVIPSIQAMVDPIDMEIGVKTKPRLNAGIRLKLAVITIHFDYTWANYSMMTAGLGISIR